MVHVKKIGFSAALVLAALLSFSGAVFAQADLKPDQVTVKTPDYKPVADFSPSLGEYKYEVSWQGIPAAGLTATITREGDTYRIITEAKTYGAIDIFYKLRYRAEGIISAYTLRPKKTIINHTENSRIKNTEINFKDGKIKSVFTRVGRPSEVMNFETDNLTLDPFSAAFLARSLDWEEGDVKEFDTYEGRSRYLIKLTALGKSTIKVNGEEVPVWEIKPEVTKLTSLKKKKSKLRNAVIYVTADSKRDILKIKSEVFVGNVYTEMQEFTPLQSTGTQVAYDKTKVIKLR